MTIPPGESISCPVRSGGTSASNVLISHQRLQFLDFAFFFRNDDIFSNQDTAASYEDADQESVGEMSGSAASRPRDHRKRLSSASSAALSSLQHEFGVSGNISVGSMSSSITAPIPPIPRPITSQEIQEFVGSDGNRNPNMKGVMRGNSVDSLSLISNNSSKVVFPKIKVKNSIPDDTLNAIKHSLSSDANNYEKAMRKSKSGPMKVKPPLPFCIMWFFAFFAYLFMWYIFNCSLDTCCHRKDWQLCRMMSLVSTRLLK